MEKKETYSNVGGNVNWCSHYGKLYVVSSKKGELPYDPAIPHCYIPRETENTTRKDIWTPMFIAALFTIAKIWKQPKCLSTDEWMKMWYIYTQGNISHKE